MQSIWHRGRKHTSVELLLNESGPGLELVGAGRDGLRSVAWRRID